MTYEIGCNDKSEIHFRISGNTGGGMFGDEWVAWGLIQPALEGDKPITSRTLRPLFRGKSANTPGFLLAVLKAEGLVKVLEGFRHTRADPKAFHAAMDKLVKKR